MSSELSALYHANTEIFLSKPNFRNFSTSMMSSPTLSRSRSPFRRCEEDQENEAMFFDAMYGQENPDTFAILTPSQATTSGYVFLSDDTEKLESEIPNHIFEQRITSESPNPITQLCVRLQFRLIKLYPLEPPIIGCKSVIGASRDQCLDLLKFLRELARERVEQVMLFDLVLAAGEWLSTKVKEGLQGSLHESMMETERLKKVQAELTTEQSRAQLEKEKQDNSYLDHLTPQREAELRRQWLQSHDRRPIVRGEGMGTFAGNLSYTMSRFVKTQGGGQLKQITGGGSSLMQTIHVLQQSLIQQQTFVSHLMAQWLALTRHLTNGNDSSEALLNYLRSESLLDEKQVEMIQFPGRISLSALFPNADGSEMSIGLLSTPAEKLSQKLTCGRSITTSRDPPTTLESGESPMSSLVKKSRYDQDFEEISYCGSGSFGDVMKVRNRLDGIFYAVKKVRIGKVGTDVASNKLVNRILREVTTLGRIHSPYVLRYHQAWIEEVSVSEEEESRKRIIGDKSSLRSSSFFEQHGFETSQDLLYSGGIDKSLCLYIQTAYCPRTLSDYLDADGRSASVAELWRLCRMMLEGLAHIHSHGILHRDLKPSNIFIDSNGDIRIGDFGLATFDVSEEVGEKEASGTAIDKTSKIGTRLYCSPEQEIGGIDYDERTDVYSLGIIFFELWHPFRSSFERIEQISKLKEGTVPGRFAESHPRQWRLITQMVKKNVFDRPTATSVLQSDLLPPRMEDDFLNDALRVVANPNTPIFPRILDKLFSPDRQSVLSKPGGKQVVAQNISSFLSLLPEPVVLEQRKEYVSSVFRQVFERHGAVRVATPIFSAVGPELELKDDESTLMDHNGSLLSLRYDSRSFFCQTMAEAFSNPASALRPDILFKRYDLGAVFRKPSRSGIHPVQLLRADFDVLGVDPVAAEAECLCIVSEIVGAFTSEIQWVRLRMNHKSLFKFVLDQADVTQSSRQVVAKAMLEPSLAPSSCSRLERWESIRRPLVLAGGALSDKQINLIGRWYRTSTGDVADAISAIEEHVDAGAETFAINQIKTILKMLERILGPRFREKEFMLDLCSPPPGDDYDGLFFTVDVSFASSPDVGEPVAVGGRLDRALSKYPDDDANCQMAGISWNVSKFVSSVMVPPNGILSAPDVLVCSLYDAKGDEATPELYSMRTEQVSIASELWRAGTAADVFYGNNSLQEQLEFAQARGVKYVVLVREKDLQTAFSEEAQRGGDDYNVSLRVLAGTKGKQLKEQIMRRSEIAAHIAHSR